MIQTLLAWLVVVSVCVSCHSDNHESVDHYASKNLGDPPSEIKIPSVLWDLLEEKKIINSLGKITPNPDAATKFEENVVVGITVRLKEKTPGILGGTNYELKSSKTGMTLDLAKYIKGNKGTFVFSFEPAYTLGAGAQVLFLSHSEFRELDGQKLGAGCGRFYDITNNYFRNFQKKGIEVNVSDGRHVSLLAGAFFFRVSHEKGVRALTQLSITDSNYPQLICPEMREVDDKE